MKHASGKAEAYGLDTLPQWPLAVLIVVLTLLGLLYLSLAFLGLLDRHAASGTLPMAARITIADIPLIIPQDLIRFDHQKTNGSMDRLDLAVPWSQNGDAPATIFVSLTPADDALPPIARVSSVYKKFLGSEIESGPANLAMRRFTPGSGYDSEQLFYDPLHPGGYFVRCAPQAADSPPSCLREIRVQDKLDIVYRFPQTLLSEWDLLEQNMSALISAIGVPDDGTRP